MKRYKCIDTIRGLAMVIMIGGHLLNWWLRPGDYWFYIGMASVFRPIGSTGFLFTSGVSGGLSYNRYRRQAEDLKIDMRNLRNLYMFRALFLLIIALIYNAVIAIAIKDFTMIWAWFILQTIAISLFMAWPLLKASKIIRITVVIVLMVANQVILALILPYQGQPNFYGILFYILFNPLDQFPILFYFSVFIFGTVVGDILYEFNLLENQIERNTAFKTKFILPLFIIGLISLISGILLLFPNFFSSKMYSIGSQLYSIGIILILLSVLIGVEEFEVIKLKKSYRFFYFHSYYSFTIFLAHNPLYLLFYGQLNILTTWIVGLITLFLMTLLLVFVYKKLGSKASLKVLISMASFKLAYKIEKRRKLKKKKS